MRRCSLGETMGCLGIVGMALFFPLSRAAFNISVLLMLVGWVLAGNFKERLRLTLSHPASWPCVVFFLLVAVGSLYSEANSKEITRQLSIYSKLLYVPLMVSLLRDAAWIRRAWCAFSAGLIILLICFYVSLFVPIPGARNIPGDLGVFNNTISQGLALAALTLHSALTAWRRWSRERAGAWFWALVGLAALLAVTYINPSRGPQLALACGFLVLAWGAASAKWRWATVSMVVALVVVVGASSTVVQNRFALVAQEIKTLHTNGKSTSVGLRLLAWQSAAEMWWSAPVLGVGTGAFQYLAYKHYAERLGCPETPVCDQPHSQFALTTAELGSVGLLLLLLIFWMPVRWAGRQPHAMRHWVAPIVGVFVVHSLFDGGLEINSQAFVFIVCVGLTLATLQHHQPVSAPGA